MNNTVPQDDDSDLQAFETPEEDFDGGVDIADEDVSADNDVNDLDFQDVDEDVFGEAPPSETQAKKKVNWFNIGVAVVAIVVAGGLIWTKLGPQLAGSDAGTLPMASVSSGVSPNGAENAQANSEAAAMAALNAGSTNTASGAGILDNPDQFANMNQAPALPMPVPAASQNDDPFAALGGDVAPSALPMPTPISGTTDVVMPAPVTEASASPVPLQPVQKEVAAVSVAVSQVQPEPVKTEPVIMAAPQDASGLKEQVGTLEKKFEALNSKLDTAIEQMSQVAAQPQVVAPVDDARLSAIQSTLDRLEARLDGLSSKKSAVTPVSSSARDVPLLPKKVTKKTAKPKPSTKWDDAYTPPEQPVRVATSVGSGGWVLRGAQKGRAIIAKGSDLREVGVGESVAGLGEITGIAVMNGRWVVQGTSGRLSQ